MTNRAGWPGGAKTRLRKAYVAANLNTGYLAEQGTRQSEAAAKVSARRGLVFSPRFNRAGFEPLRGRATSLHFKRLRRGKHAGRCNPHAWLKSDAIQGWEIATDVRAEIFAPPGTLPNLSFVICHLSFHGAQRDCAMHHEKPLERSRRRPL